MARRANGTSQQITVGDAATWKFIHETAIFALGGWVRLDDYTADDLQVMVGSSISSTHTGFYFGYDNRSSQGSPSVLRCVIDNASGTDYVLSSNNNAIQDNNWHHVLVTGDGSDVVFYVDGVAHGTDGGIGALPTGDATQAPLLFGAGGAAGTWDLHGMLAEWGVWDVEVSARVAASLANYVPVLEGAPISWLRLLGAPLFDEMGEAALSNNGTTEDDDHPIIIDPTQPLWTPGAAAPASGAGGLIRPRLLHSRLFGRLIA